VSAAAEEVVFLDDVTVDYIDHMGDDAAVTQAARVSVVGENKKAQKADAKDKEKGLIGYLMRKKHGSPFEHTAMKFYVKAPIFVFREFHRHRIGFSYNEMSGRYTKLLPEFYVPKKSRPLVNTGGSANPKFEPGSNFQTRLLERLLQHGYKVTWAIYSALIKAGIGNEVARVILPVGIYSQMYVTCNARSLMSFLSLRTFEPEATFPSNPQHEIELVARKMEEEFARLFPITYEAWVARGRVAP